MRAPSWESSAGALAALLNSATQVYMVDLYTITLSGGSVLRYTSADSLVTVNSLAYLAGPAIKRGATKLAVGIMVDTLELTLIADTSVTINGVPLLQFIAGGGFDNARVVLARAFAAAPGSAWVGTLDLFPGRVNDTSITRSEAVITVNSDSELLNVMIPRNVYMPGCGNTLFDGTCGLAKASFVVNATCSTGSSVDRLTFACSSLTQPVDYFALGWAVCLTGANAGVGRTIRNSGSGNVVTLQAWPAAIAIGDTFKFYPGCDKQQATCNTKFANLARFRGYPYVPAPETVL